MSRRPRRTQRRRAKGWRAPEGAIYVGRPGPWGNPFVVGKHGTAVQCVRNLALLLGGFISLSDGPEVKVQRAYREYVAKHIDELREHDLMCWCRPDQLCHADILLVVANAKGSKPSLPARLIKRLGLQPLRPVGA